MNLQTYLDTIRRPGEHRVAVAAAEDTAALHAALCAQREGIATPVLFGDDARIRAAADELGLDLSGTQVHHASTPGDAARAAIAHVRAGGADMLMKGGIQTAEFMRAVLDKESGLRQGRTLSHVSVLQVPGIGRPLFLTDCALVPYPDLAAKAELVRNAVAVAARLGVSLPKVAPLAAVEVVNPDMPATLDAAALTQMNRRGQLAGCVVDGPLAMDLALSAEAAHHKGLAQNPVAGAADVLLFHNIEAGNSVLKAFTCSTDSLFGGVVVGAAAPIVLPSRSDSIDNKLYAIACAAAAAGA